MGRKKKVFRGLGIVFVAFLVVTFIQMNGVSWVKSFAGWAKLKPETDFNEYVVPDQPDYSLMPNWAAHPEKKDAADVVPYGDYQDNQKNAQADVFFIHPTTYYNNQNWNQPQGDAEAEKILDEWALKNQASAFNGCCRVFAPRYRQATLYTFMDLEGDGKKAMKVAYSDVKRAFTDYLAHQNQGRSFMIAAHSQGAYHGIKLLSEFARDDRVVQNLIAAYVIGMPLKKEQLNDISYIEVCETPKQTGCLIAWNTIDNNAVGWVSSHLNDSVCVNPLTWKTDETQATIAQNLGSVRFTTQNGTNPKPDAGMADARCQNGVLRISTPKLAKYLEDPLPLGEGNYHIYDYSLFYLNIRQNANDRVSAYINQNSYVRKAK